MLIKCQCFSKVTPKTQTVFTMTFKTEETFKDFVSSSTDMVVPRSMLRVVENGLYVFNPITQAPTINRTLVTSQTNIFSLLNKSFIKSGSDPVKWYVFSAARLVAGDPTELPYTFTNIKALLNQYHCIPKHSGVDAAPAGPRRHSDNVFGIYETSFGGGLLLDQINLTSEYISVARVGTQRLGGVYDSFNSVRDIVTSGSVSFANLQFYESLTSRFPSVLDVLLSSANSEEEDKKAVEHYKTTVSAVNDSGCEHIKEYLRKTSTFDDYTPEKHYGYTFPPKKSLLGVVDGMTPIMSCGQLTKNVMNGKDMFPNSICNIIKGTNVYSLSGLCNSNRKLLMSGERVQDLLRTVHSITTNVPILASPIAKEQGYRYCTLLSPSKLDDTYTDVTALTAVTRHTQDPSMVSYNTYSRAFRGRCPSLTLNEVINPRMTVFSLAIDVDDRDLINTFYSTSVSDTWPHRAEVVRVMKEAMTDFVSTIDPSGVILGGSDATRGAFSCYSYESRPDNAKHTKVGLRFIYKFCRLAFKDTTVVRDLLKAFRFFVCRKAKSIGCSIDEAIYSSEQGHLLRLPMMGKHINGDKSLSRQLIPLFVEATNAFKPSAGLVHMEHPTFDRETARVLTSIGDISDLVTKYSPKDAEFFLLNKKGGMQRNRWWKKQTPADDDDTSLKCNYTTFFNGLLDNVLMPAVWARGAGGGLPQDTFQEVRRRIGKTGDEYAIIPAIKWCTLREHVNPHGNPCRYFLNVRKDDTFSMSMFCYGCGVDSAIYVGDLPKHATSP